jgi:DNA-binding transcriptional LysR family regulator
MDFRQLETLVAIVRHNSFTRAAEELFLTQPALSGHIQALENELGAVILDRAGKNIALTEAGKILYDYAVNLLNMREQALYQISAYQGRLEGKLAIASSNVPQQHLLPGLLKDFSRNYPHITYIIRQFDSKGVMDAILSGDVDFGFIGAEAFKHGLEAVPVCRDRLVVIAPSCDELANTKGRAIRWDLIAGRRYILREKGSGTREHFEGALRKAGIDAGSISVVAEVENQQTLIQCVKAGLGISVVSERSVADDVAAGKLLAFSIEGVDLERDLCFIYHKNRVLNPVTAAFKDFVCGVRLE